VRSVQMGNTVLFSVIGRRRFEPAGNFTGPQKEAHMTTTETTTEPTTPKMPKSATITLHAADGSRIQICAERKGDGARSFVITTGVDKKSLRGMSETHPTFEAAKAAIAKLAREAEKRGWVRKVAGRHFVAKPDAFTSMPSAPKGKK